MLRLAHGLALTLVVAWPASTASATTFVVNTEEDISAACGATCSLRGAIGDANTTVSIDGSPNLIVLPAATLKRNPAFAAPEVTAPVTIVGKGARLTTIRGSNAPGFSSRGLTLTGPVGGTIAVQLRDLSVSGGLSEATSSSTNPGQGGGVTANRAQLTLHGVTIAGNQALDGRGPTNASTSVGGGIFANATLTVEDSTVSGNRATGTYASGNNALSAGGGGIYVQAALATVTNSTISGNIAEAGPGIASGGGLSLGSGGQLDGVTIAANQAIGTKPATSGNLAASTFSPPTVRGSIVAGGVAGATNGNCLFPVTSLGGNVEDANQCGFTTPSDRASSDPRLGALGDHGGPTDTQDLLAGSPAIDRAGACVLPADQRGTTRPQGSACDAGAFELFQAPPTPPSSSGGATTSNATGGGSGSGAGGAGAGTSTAATGAPPVAAGPVSCTLHPRGTTSGLLVDIACDRAATVVVGAEATLKPRRARAAARRRKPKLRRVRLRGATVTVAAGAPARVTLAVPRAVRTIVKKHGRASLQLTASVDGQAAGSASLAKLKARRRARRR